jgi:hypothetical protein
MDQGGVRPGMRALALIPLMTAGLLGGIKHDFDKPVFVYGHHPDLPISEYANGRLGIPEPEHARIYLYAAYRYLENNPFTAVERDAYLRVWQVRKAREMISLDESGQRAWDKIRNSVPVAAETPSTMPATRLTRGWVYREICADDAFGSAAKTLRERILQFGLRSAAVAFWVRGQDRVFDSCDPAHVHLPEAAPASLPPLIRADREYQTAAALLYSQRLDEALSRFRSIARDSGSPWRIWAPYLAGRTLLWQARLTQNDKVFLDKLREAEAQFRAVLADRRLSLTHAAAERLLDRCLLATRPKAGLERLASRLVSHAAARTLETDLSMYLNGIDDLTQFQYGDDKASRTAKLALLPRDDFSLWWETFQSRDPRAYTTALERWRQSGRRAWLFCSLAKAQSDSPGADDLLDKGLKAGLDEPAGPAIRFQVARVLAVKERFGEARTEIDAVLTVLASLPSARNRALELKSLLAPNMEEFLKLAPRSVIMASTEMDTDEFESQVTDYGSWNTIEDPALRARARRDILREISTAARLASLERLDSTGVRVFNERLPLELLRQIALTQGSLPPHLAAELRLVVWTRSVLLGRFEVSREFAPLVARDHPSVAVELQVFIKAADGRPVENAAAWVLLKLPGAHPYMSRGYGRIEPIEKHDEWARNWWYRFTPGEMYGIDAPYVGDQASFGRQSQTREVMLARLPFLTESQQQQAAGEWQRLRTSGERGFNWLSLRIAEDVRDHPERPDGAKALYDVIRAAEVSWWASRPDYDLPKTGLKAAYRLLSTRYQHSIWLTRARSIEGLFLDQLK